MSDDEDYLGSKDLIWAPGTKELTAAQLAAIHTRHANAIRPIPSRTALGYDHLMADADRGALLAELNRLRAALTALSRNERAAADRALELQEENERLRVENDELLAGSKYLSNRLGTQIEAHERTTQKLENAYAERALLFSELKRTVEGQTNE